MTAPSYDLAVVGAGILGLAYAWAAASRGLKVVVIDRDAQANGASIRNFGFVTVTGQQAGDCWRLARRSSNIWREVAEAAQIPVLQRGMILAARRPEAVEVIDAFLKTPMGEACRMLSPQQASQLIAPLRSDRLEAALHSPHELRIESRTALPRLAAWLAEVHGVTFLWSRAVHAICPPCIDTSGGTIHATHAICCPGDDTHTLFAERLARYGVGRTKLQMMRLVPKVAPRMECALMSDLGLARYRGYADLPQAAALARRLDDEQGEERAAGIHLIAVRSADGSLVVGDSHDEGQTPDPFVSERINHLILREMENILALGPYRVSETWVGTYAKARDRWRITDAPDAQTRIVIVTAGCGASTAFGIAEETVADLLGEEVAA